MFADFQKDELGQEIIGSEYAGEFSKVELEMCVGVLEQAGFKNVAFNLVDAFRAYVESTKWA